MTQHEKILELLRGAGNKGINSFGVAREIALQLPTRIKELKEKGHIIVTRVYKDRSVDYILIEEKKSKKKQEEKTGRWDFSTGVARWVEGGEPKQKSFI